MAKVLHFRYIFYPFLALLFGLTMASRLFAGNITTIVCVLLTFCALATGLFLFGKWNALVIIMAFFLLGNGGYFLAAHFQHAKVYKGECAVVARVTDNFTVYGDELRIVLDDVKINGQSAKNIYLTLNCDESDIKAGDKLTFAANLQNADFITTGYNNFYLRNHIGYMATCSLENIIIISSHLKFDESFRMSVKNLLYQNMSEENASISYAVLFGDKSGIDYATKEIFRNAGVIHILTVSGLHVGFLVAFVCFLLSLIRIKRVYTTIISAIFLIFFNILCGFAPSVFRASVMAMVIMCARASARPYDKLNSLGLAGFIILAVNPLYALDIGFLMSFGCVAVIFLLFPPLSNLLKKIMHPRIAEGISISICAEIGILPFMASMGMKFNILSFFANLLIVPIFSVLYPFLFVISVVSLLIPFLAKSLILVDFGFTAIKAVASFFASTGAVIALKPFSLPVSILIFITIFLLSHIVMVKKEYKFVGISLLCLALSVTTGLMMAPL